MALHLVHERARGIRAHGVEVAVPAEPSPITKRSSACASSTRRCTRLRSPSSAQSTATRSARPDGALAVGRHRAAPQPEQVVRQRLGLEAPAAAHLEARERPRHASRRGWTASAAEEVGQLVLLALDEDPRLAARAAGGLDLEGLPAPVAGAAPGDAPQRDAAGLPRAAGRVSSAGSAAGPRRPAAGRRASRRVRCTSRASGSERAAPRRRGPP